jgi:hypothetical protein
VITSIPVDPRGPARAAANPNAFGEAALTLADLFAARPGALASPAQPVSRDIPTDVLVRWSERQQADELLPDTLFAAAWLLLQARWLGCARVALVESGSAGGTRFSIDCDGASTVAGWLHAVDRARREPASGPDADAASPVALWVRPDGTLAISGEPPLIQLGVEPAPDASGTLHWRVAADRLEAAVIDSLLDALADTTLDLLERPGTALRDIRTLPAADRERQLEAWNQPPTAYDPTLTVHAMFDRQVAARGDAIALVAEDGALSYRELDRRAEHMARRLHARGVRAGSTVGVILDRSGSAIVALLAILKAGAAYVPVQPDFPAERIAFMLDDSRVAIVVTQARHRQLVASGHPVLSVDEPAGDDAAPMPLADIAADGESLAYVMYTSGSTGTPKGIEICHRSILRLVVDPHYVDRDLGAALGRRHLRGA